MKSKCELLAGQLRAAGWHKRGEGELELALNRPLSRFERRAFAMATDSLRSQDGMKQSHSKRQTAIVTGLQSKQARLPRPVSIDPVAARTVPQKAFSNTPRTGAINDRPAKFAHIEGLQCPDQAAMARRAIIQRLPEAKPEQWDKKR